MKKEKATEIIISDSKVQNYNKELALKVNREFHSQLSNKIRGESENQNKINEK